MSNFDDITIDFDDFSSSTSTSCDSPAKLLTREALDKAIMAIKAERWKCKPDFKFNMRHTLGFNSTVFSRIHTI